MEKEDIENESQDILTEGQSLEEGLEDIEEEEEEEEETTTSADLAAQLVTQCQDTETTAPKEKDWFTAVCRRVLCSLDYNYKKVQDDIHVPPGDRGAGDMEGEQADKEKEDTQEEPKHIFSRFDLPQELPNIVEIKKALPAHCFESSPWTSLYFMAKDFTLVALFYLLSEWSWTHLPVYAQLVLTPLYWVVQGVIYTGIFVVGHDAGHGSFSSSQLLNDVCGNICHSFLFCPYFMWKLSHRNHHKNTGNIDKDEVFYPLREGDFKRPTSMMPGFGLGIGWFVYLVQGYGTRGVRHYDPRDPMFDRNVSHCLLSLGFLGVWGSCLAHYCSQYGMASLAYHWLVPVLGFGSFIVAITFLHHHDVHVPWYTDRLWHYVRGQLSSVDRHYGWCHRLIHNIGTHQIHHLFPMIPHYHLEEATASFRRTFPHLVRMSSEPILPAFYHMFKKYVEQSVIRDLTQVHVYR